MSIVPARDADLISAFNFCDPFDGVLPPHDPTISSLDMQHLWGLSTSIVVGEAQVQAPSILDINMILVEGLSLQLEDTRYFMLVEKRNVFM